MILNSDSSGSGGDGMYPMMKPVPGGSMPGVSYNYLNDCF